MFGTVTNERLLSCGYRQVFAFDRFRFEFRHLMTELVAAVSVLVLSMISFAVTANAVEANCRMTVFQHLRDYVQLIESGRKLDPQHRPSTNLGTNTKRGCAYAELRSFRGANWRRSTQATNRLPKLAGDADSLIDFLRGGVRKAIDGTEAAGHARSPVGTKESAPVDATYVGAKVCVTCHATQAELFKHTLMGRINQTQKGKFDCENCHGPGSAHVKAGGGRGVGGIISFRPDDLSRTAEENNASVSAATREATGLTGTAARTMSAA